MVDGGASIVTRLYTVYVWWVAMFVAVETTNVHTMAPICAYACLLRQDFLCQCLIATYDDHESLVISWLFLVLASTQGAFLRATLDLRRVNRHVLPHNTHGHDFGIHTQCFLK